MEHPCQHHDAATGTERQAVADDYSMRMNRALQTGGSAINLSDFRLKILNLKLNLNEF